MLFELVFIAIFQTNVREYCLDWLQLQMFYNKIETNAKDQCQEHMVDDLTRPRPKAWRTLVHSNRSSLSLLGGLGELVRLVRPCSQQIGFVCVCVLFVRLVCAVRAGKAKLRGCYRLVSLVRVSGCVCARLFG